MSGVDGPDLVVKEGFLCPICLRDLGDIVQLQVHVTEGHSAPSGPSDAADLALHQLKDLFGRAKQRILKFESTLTAMTPPIQLSMRLDDDQQQLVTAVTTNQSGPGMEQLPSPQTIGPTTSHTGYFKRIRDARVDQCAVETNKIIIRLDKLISEAPTDPSKRKAFEKETVPWTSDADVQYCRDCGGKFSLTKRRHHCRLCGRIMCGGCSQFLTFSYAKKLTNPAFAAGYKAAADSGEKGENEGQEGGGGRSNVTVRRPSGSSAGSPNMQFKAAGEKLLSALTTKLKRDGSEVSLSSLFNQEGEDQLRICKECRRLLDNRDQQIEQRTQPPIITQMYERLRSSMEDAEKLFPLYCNMAESLGIGESLHDLETAKDVRLRLLKIQEQIDFLSKRIATLGAAKSDGGGENVENTVQLGLSVRQQMLQKNVRQFAAAFLQDIAYHTPALPTPTEYTKLQAEYKKVLEMRIERERAIAAALAAAQSQKVTEFGSPPPRQSSPDPSSQYQRKLLSGGGDTDSGWTPDTSSVTATLFRFNPFDEEQTIDPLREQILLTKGYIKQAAMAGRLEEVKLLERNLHELEEELKLQNAAVTPRPVE